MRIRTLLAAGAAGLAFMPMPASALLCGTILEPVRVTTTGLNFGNYAPGQGTKSFNGTVQIDCGLLSLDLLPNFTVSLGPGNGPVTGRYMLRGGTHLNYNIYTQGGAIWGDSSGGQKQTYNTVLSLGTVTFTAYGQIPGGQFVASGTYTDSLTVTVDY
jgi:spore coat protein U-like protein